MDYYETRASLIFYLYRMVDEDSWRFNNSLNKFRVVSYLYRTLADDVKVFIQVVILYYFKYFENSNFIIIYNKILDGMCEFYDEVVLSKRV